VEKVKFNNKEKGFTLLEIMITVAIISILASIAYPSYVKSVQKGKRSDAKVELLRIAQMQEGFFAQNMSYAPNLAGLGLPSNLKSEQEEYSIEVEGLPDSCTTATPCTSFLITATPIGSQLQDTDCPKFTLTSTGQKGIGSSSSTADQIRRCWK